MAPVTRSSSGAPAFLPVGPAAAAAGADELAPPSAPPLLSMRTRATDGSSGSEASAATRYCTSALGGAHVRSCASEAAAAAARAAPSSAGAAASAAGDVGWDEVNVKAPAGAGAAAAVGDVGFDAVKLKGLLPAAGAAAGAAVAAPNPQTGWVRRQRAPARATVQLQQTVNRRGRAGGAGTGGAAALAVTAANGLGAACPKPWLGAAAERRCPTAEGVWCGGGRRLPEEATRRLRRRCRAKRLRRRRGAPSELEA